MDSNYRPGLNWPVTSSGTGFSESSRALALPSALSPLFPLSKFPNFPSNIDFAFFFLPLLLVLQFLISLLSNCRGRSFDHPNDLWVRRGKVRMSKRVWSNLFCLARFVRLLDWIEGTTSTEVMSIPSVSRKGDVRNKTHQVSKSCFLATVKI